MAPFAAELDSLRKEVASVKNRKTSTRLVRGDDGLIAGADEVDENGAVVRRRRVRRGDGGRVEGLDDG